MVKRGKPSAILPVQNRYVKQAKEKILKNYGLQVYEQQLSEGWTVLWIYKKDYMLEVIKMLPEKPKTIFDHWVLGKVFGYSDEAIEEFIRG
jgi:hypothetical protein